MTRLIDGKLYTSSLYWLGLVEYAEINASAVDIRLYWSECLYPLFYRITRINLTQKINNFELESRLYLTFDRETKFVGEAKVMYLAGESMIEIGLLSKDSDLESMAKYVSEVVLMDMTMMMA